MFRMCNRFSIAAILSTTDIGKGFFRVVPDLRESAGVIANPKGEMNVSGKACVDLWPRIASMANAMKWHPDRCSASENSKLTEEAKKKFQAIQEAYSVLSDGNKRFMYDVGAYNSDDDENENGKESFEELQDLFEEMFQRDIDAFNSTSHTASSSGSNNNNKRNCPDMSSKVDDLSGFDAQLRNFCLGVSF
ncbi:hypothetical protein HHK36_021923 [Tetracentron sinense]|uniref:J domain-containing protein n=1 Tax=Tetracentron sinense TaxID=13715 RepID=A0A835D8A8_TETSI|nr:hypothetical protein HHK36_021923 [Tetracentron sinense]